MLRGPAGIMCLEKGPTVFNRDIQKRLTVEMADQFPCLPVTFLSHSIPLGIVCLTIGIQQMLTTTNKSLFSPIT